MFDFVETLSVKVVETKRMPQLPASSRLFASVRADENGDLWVIIPYSDYGKTRWAFIPKTEHGYYRFKAIKFIRSGTTYLAFKYKEPNLISFAATRSNRVLVKELEKTNVLCTDVDEPYAERMVKGFLLIKPIE